MTAGFGAAARDFRRLAWRECRRKRVYESREDARLATRAAQRRGAEVHPYRCRLCDGWHIGHAPGDTSATP